MALKILVLGGEGMLGRAVVDAASANAGNGVSFEAIAVGRSLLDLVDTPKIAAELKSDFDAVINCAAFTAVDACEGEIDRAMEVNGAAVGRLASVCQELGVSLLHISSDYVFSGEGVCDSTGALRPYREQDPVGPVSAYGKSKELGERLALDHGAFVVRASWLFGPGGQNFVTTMLRLAEAGQPIRVVNDQIGCPTYTPDLAAGLLRLLGSLVAHGDSAPRGNERPLPREQRLFHFANPPAVSWYGFAKEIFEVFGEDAQLSPCESSEYPRPAPRPSYSVLETERWFEVLGERPRAWQQCLRDYREVLRGGVGAPK